MDKIITILAANNTIPGVTTINPVKGENNTNISGDLTGAITPMLNAIIGALGIVCVGIIIFGGVQYMTSTGDSGKVKKAKDTILYGVIGLVICALAAVIVNFVISNIIGA